MATHKIIYTKTDEAPALATQSLLPIIKAFTIKAGVDVETRDISLAGRILANFPDCLNEDQKVADALSELGKLVNQPDANIIKLPNISASIPQLKAAIAELQAQGYGIPNFPDEPANAQEADYRERYDKIKGSAVNPVLREGNSDRRAPKAVKEYARKNPHSMGAWSADSKSHVSSMTDGDFYGSEQSYCVPEDTEVRIEHRSLSGETNILKSNFPVLSGEIIDSAVLSKNAFVEFLKAQLLEAKEQGVLFSIHLKATMMKVSDPILFGHAVKAYFAEVFEKHGAALEKAGANPNNGLGNVLAQIAKLPKEQTELIEADIRAAFENGPDLAMVDSDRGITNLHVPSDVIIDASMPAMIRTSGKMWNKEGKAQDTKAVIPDRSYAGI